MIFTDRSAASIISCNFRQVIPACTVISFLSASNATTSSRPRMSICRLFGYPICPPWLYRPPPIEIGPVLVEIASEISSIESGTMTRATRIRLSPVMSLTTTSSVGQRKSPSPLVKTTMVVTKAVRPMKTAMYFSSRRIEESHCWVLRG